jgi:hypothetical protein
MSNITITAEATRRMKLLNLPPKPNGLHGMTVTLIDFADNATAMLLTGGMSANYQKDINNQIKRYLERRHAVVHRRVITLDETVRWADNGMFEPTLQSQ